MGASHAMPIFGSSPEAVCKIHAFLCFLGPSTSRLRGRGDVGSRHATIFDGGGGGSASRRRRRKARQVEMPLPRRLLGPDASDYAGRRPYGFRAIGAQPLRAGWRYY